MEYLMYNEWFSHLSKTIQKDISFSLKVQMVQAKMNSHFNLLVYSLICIKKYTRHVFTLALENDDEHFN